MLTVEGLGETVLRADLHTEEGARLREDASRELDARLEEARREEEGVRSKIIDMHLKSLDDLVNVNSLFTAAVFIGSSFASPDQRSLDDRRECDVHGVMARKLVLYEVLSFALFLISSLAAKSLKVLLNIFKLREDPLQIKLAVKFVPDPISDVFVSWPCRRIMLSISTVCSALGVIFLTLSMMVVIQMRLGKLSCGNSYTIGSVISLIVLVVFALVLYLPPMIFTAIANTHFNSRVGPMAITEILSTAISLDPVNNPDTGAEPHYE